MLKQEIIEIVIKNTVIHIPALVDVETGHIRHYMMECIHIEYID